jgi:hypothetical protein
MVKEANAGVDIILAVAVKIDSTFNFGFLGITLNLSAASVCHGRGPLVIDLKPREIAREYVTARGDFGQCQHNVKFCETTA